MDEDEYDTQYEYDLDSYHLQTALELALGTDEVLSNEDVPPEIRIRTVLQATNIFLKCMTEEGYIEGALGQ